MNIHQAKAEAEMLRKHGYGISDTIKRLTSEANHDGFERGEDHVVLYFQHDVLIVTIGGASIYRS
jgi:hypothetical protein